MKIKYRETGITAEEGGPGPNAAVSFGLKHCTM